MNLKTKRLILKNYTESEKDAFLKLMTSPEVMKFVGVLKIEKAENLWRKLLDDFYKRGLKTFWAVFEKNENRFIGHATLRPRPEKKEEWELGFILKKEEWGKGFATEIALVLIEFGFKNHGLEEVFATVDDDNFASINVLKKAGMNLKRYEFDEEGRFSVFSIKRKKKN